MIGSKTFSVKELSLLTTTIKDLKSKRLNMEYLKALLYTGSSLILTLLKLTLTFQV